MRRCAFHAAGHDETPSDDIDRRRVDTLRPDVRFATGISKASSATSP
jgi:hypothetical protein